MIQWPAVLWIAKSIVGLAREAPASRQPVLIVDDSHDDAEMLASYVRREGSDPVIVRTIQDAEDALAEKHFRMVFLDVHFPRGSGIEFAKRIRPRFPRLPVVLVSGYPESVQSLPSGRKWSFIFKGTSGGSLMEAVHDALLEANGLNGHLPGRGVFVTAWLLCAASALFGIFARELMEWLK